jgi:hypothetical protein
MDMGTGNMPKEGAEANPTSRESGRCRQVFNPIPDRVEFGQIRLA